MENSIGKDLALRRICLNLRQWQVAKQAGICRTVLSDYETGKRSISLATEKRIREAITALARERSSKNGV
jgi:predicted transcriptional regulator